MLTNKADCQSTEQKPRTDSADRRAPVIYLDAVVLLVADVDEAERVGRDAPGVVEAALHGAVLTERAKKAARRVKYLDPVVIPVRKRAYENKYQVSRRLLKEIVQLQKNVLLI